MDNNSFDDSLSQVEQQLKALRLKATREAFYKEIQADDGEGGTGKTGFFTPEWAKNAGVKLYRELNGRFGSAGKAMQKLSEGKPNLLVDGNKNSKTTEGPTDFDQLAWRDPPKEAAKLYTNVLSGFLGKGKLKQDTTDFIEAVLRDHTFADAVDNAIENTSSVAGQAFQTVMDATGEYLGKEKQKWDEGVEKKYGKKPESVKIFKKVVTELKVLKPERMKKAINKILDDAFIAAEIAKESPDTVATAAVAGIAVTVGTMLAAIDQKEGTALREEAETELIKANEILKFNAAKHIALRTLGKEVRGSVLVSSALDKAAKKFTEISDNTYKATKEGIDATEDATRRHMGLPEKIRKPAITTPLEPLGPPTPIQPTKMDTLMKEWGKRNQAFVEAISKQDTRMRKQIMEGLGIRVGDLEKEDREAEDKRLVAEIQKGVDEGMAIVQPYVIQSQKNGISKKVIVQKSIAEVQNKIADGSNAPAVMAGAFPGIAMITSQMNGDPKDLEAVTEIVKASMDATEQGMGDQIEKTKQMVKQQMSEAKNNKSTTSNAEIKIDSKK